MPTPEELENLRLPNVSFPNRFWVHLWVEGRYPMFNSSWSIYQEKSDDDFIVYQRDWHLNWKLNTEIKHKEFIPEQTRLFQLIEYGKTIKIPIIGVKNRQGKDGALFGVVFNSPTAKHIELRWWSHGPNEWRELVNWYIELVDFLKLEAERL